MARCVVIGSVARDEILELTAPLVPGRHLEAVPRGTRLGGGAAGTGLALAHAGHHVLLLSPVGTDAEGARLIEELAAEGLDTSAMRRIEGPSTRSLVLLEPGGERTIVNLHRCREPGPPERLRDLAADCVYVRSHDLDLAALLEERVRAGLVVAHLPPLAAGSRPAQVLVASEADLPADALASPWEAGRRVAGAHLRWVVITRGPHGAQAFAADRQLRVPAPQVEVVDSTGAGDVFAAGLVHALLAGQPMERALDTAAAWGAAAVACQGLPARDAIARLA